ncbi:hypothetical protein [Bacillus cereus]|uniref:hypothetical protein n=1 Tax=Bacillus cereus TaxID=1396 RepID=UPI0018A772A8|nr:hypothetical protein [Bacillus cereus]MBF8118157.1 hypothetical protein [Bacillus cereus]
MKILRRKETIPFSEFMKKEKKETNNIKSYSMIPIPFLNFDWYSFITSPTPFIILGVIVTIPILSSVCSKFFMDTPLEQFFYRFETGLNVLYPVVKLGILGVIIYYAKVMFL